MNLYHYTSEDSAIKILENLTLKITPPNKLNDPFEILPSSYKNVTQENVTEYYNKLAKREFEKIYEEALQDGFRGTIQEFLENFDEQKIIEDLAETIPNRDFTKLKNVFSEIFGVVSFSQNNNNILMWSHYADQHQGIVIGFDSTKFGKKSLKVEYSYKRVELTFGNNKTTMKFKKEVENLIQRKAKNWEYEKEYRMLLELKDLQKKGNDYFLGFNVNIIDMIIFGSRISKTTKKKIMGMKLLNKVKFFESNLSKSKFELDIERI